MEVKQAAGSEVGTREDKGSREHEQSTMINKYENATMNYSNFIH